jgi:hypothetical protein
MPISPGSPWGAISPLPESPLAMTSDRELGIFLRDHSAKQIHEQSIFMKSGDIPRVLGVLDRPRDADCLRVVIDAIVVSYTDTAGNEHNDVCIASLSIARRFFRGSICVVTNSGYWKGHEVAPRAHLNDGKLDIFEVSGAMRWSQRRMMWKKTRAGSHLPHPLLSYSQGDYFHWKGSLQRLIIDNQYVGMVKNVSCRVQSDCAQVYA